MYTFAMAKTLPTGVTEVGIKELRADLSAWVQRVAAGERVVITAHRKPVARLTPYTGVTGLERMIAEGRVRLPTNPKRPASDFEKTPRKGNVSDIVIEQRRERDRSLRHLGAD